jgi:putative membrane protein
MYDWHDSGWGPGAWIAMVLVMLAFWTLIVFLVVYVVRTLGHRDSGQSATAAPDQARRILDERLARGEIDAHEYNQRRQLLRSN